MTKETISQAEKGDADAFAEIVRQYRRMVWRISLRILGDPDEAEDAVQETFIRAWKALPGYDSSYSMATWLGSIACRLCYDILRQRTRRLRYEQETLRASSGDMQQDPESGNIAEELEKQLQTVTRSLSPMQRTVFVLREIEQLSFGEIREITGWSSIQIKSNLYIARQSVRKAIERHLTE